MKKTVTALLVVGILLIANFIGIVMFSATEDSKDSSDSYVEENFGPNDGDDIKGILTPESNMEDDYDQTEDGIPWHLLPQDKNPRARLFLDQNLLAIELRLPEMTFEETKEGEIIYLDGFDTLLEPGNPLVPECKFFVAVPSDAQIKHVEVVDSEARVLEENHAITPYIPQTVDGVILPIDPNQAVYSSENLFPQDPFKIQGPDKLRHLDALEVSLYPVRVRPAIEKVEVYDILRLKIELEPSDNSQLTFPALPIDDEIDKNILELIANPEDVILSHSPEFSSSPTTRAPASIDHTLGFHGSAATIHPSDTTTGNAGGVSLLQTDDDEYYDAEAGETMYLDGFDTGSANSAATLEYAMLHLEYVGTDNYDGSSYVRWAVDGDPLQESTIQPTDLDDSESGDLSFNLLGHANSPSTVSDITDLDIEFTENGTGGGSQDIPFDYIWIEFAYREELSGDSDYLIITDIALTDELRLLAEWKTQRLGIDAQVYDTDWINSNWDGSNLKERIHDFIRSMYENYSIEWVLLCGDDVDIPTDTSTRKYDNYYANVVGFQYPDLSLGRLPSSEDDLMEGMVDDIVSHQRDMRPWKNNMYLVGTNVFGTGDGKTHMVGLKNSYMLEYDFNYYEDYEVEGNNSNSRTIDHYNMGMGASNYYGHGSSGVWTRNNGSTTLIRKSDVIDDFNNSEKRGFVWTLSCSTARYLGSSTSIGEAWVIQRNGGGIGYIGGAEIVYVSPGRANHWGFWRAYGSMMDNGESPTQGEVHFRAQNTNYYGIYVLYGDPQVGLSLTEPQLDIAAGSFDSGSFVEQIGFDQNDQVTFDTLIEFKSVLPKGVHINLSVHNEAGDVYYLDETYISDPEDAIEKMFWNWTIPSAAVSGIYNVTVRIYNTSQGWDFVLENRTYFYVDYHASLFWIEQVNSEVIEGDTVTYRIHIDNFIDPIPAASVWVNLEGRDYNPYNTPFDYSGSNTTAIPSEMDFIVEIEVPISEPGTHTVTAGITIDWALMDSISGDDTEVRGIRILETSFNHPIFFREDTANISFRYFAFSDFSADAALAVAAQTNILYSSHSIENGTNWLNFTWTVPKFLPNDTYNVDLDVNGFARNLETKTYDMRVVNIREILDKGEEWLIPRQQPNGGYNESEMGWPPEQNPYDTARVMQALIWSGMDPSDPLIQDAADFVESNISLDYPGRVDDFSQAVWSMVEADRGSSPFVQDSSEVIRNIQNWIYEPENWTLIFQGMMNDTWLVNVSGYDNGGSLLYSHNYNGTVNFMWGYTWVNFTVLPGTEILNVTINTSAWWIQGNIFSPYTICDPFNPWATGIRVDDSQGPGDGIKWNMTASEEIEFDRGWGKLKGMSSIAGFTAWGIIGLLQSGVLSPSQYEALTTGVQWLLDNQSVDGSWNPFANDGMWGGGDAYPEMIAGSWGTDFIQNTAMSVIALVMNGTLGSAVDDGIGFLKTKQADNGSYPYSPWKWDHAMNLISTAHTMRAFKRAGYVFEINSPYVREAARWLCDVQNEYSGNWEVWANFTRIPAEAMMALANLKFSHTMELEPGWNLVSLSLIPEDASLSAVLKSIDGEYDAVQWKDAADTDDPWKHYMVGKPYGNDLPEINEEMGFWVHITNPAGASFVYTGTEPAKNQEISLYKGWNLVGYPAQCYRERTDALNTIIFGSDVDAVWTYNAELQTWEEISNSDSMVPENGYWIHSKVDKTWEVPL